MRAVISWKLFHCAVLVVSIATSQVIGQIRFADDSQDSRQWPPVLRRSSSRPICNDGASPITPQQQSPQQPSESPTGNHNPYGNSPNAQQQPNQNAVGYSAPVDQSPYQYSQPLVPVIGAYQYQYLPPSPIVPYQIIPQDPTSVQIVAQEPYQPQPAANPSPQNQQAPNSPQNQVPYPTPSQTPSPYGNPQHQSQNPQPSQSPYQPQNPQPSQSPYQPPSSPQQPQSYYPSAYPNSPQSQPPYQGFPVAPANQPSNQHSQSVSNAPTQNAPTPSTYSPSRAIPPQRNRPPQSPMDNPRQLPRPQKPQDSDEAADPVNELGPNDSNRLSDPNQQQPPNPGALMQLLKKLNSKIQDLEDTQKSLNKNIDELQEKLARKTKVNATASALTEKNTKAAVDGWKELRDNVTSPQELKNVTNDIVSEACDQLAPPQTVMEFVHEIPSDPTIKDAAYDTLADRMSSSEELQEHMYWKEMTPYCEQVGRDIGFNSPTTSKMVDLQDQMRLTAAKPIKDCTKFIDQQQYQPAAMTWNNMTIDIPPEENFNQLNTNMEKIVTKAYGGKAENIQYVFQFIIVLPDSQSDFKETARKCLQKEMTTHGHYYDPETKTGMAQPYYLAQ